MSSKIFQKSQFRFILPIINLYQLLVLLDMYPNEITSTAEYDSLLENELPKEHWFDFRSSWLFMIETKVERKLNLYVFRNSYHLKSKTTSNLGLNDYANLDCGGWFNDVMIMSYLDRVLKGQKDLGGNLLTIANFRSKVHARHHS